MKKYSIIPGLSQEKIKQYADSDAIYRRGQEYYESEAVTDIHQCDQQIQAEVEGSQYEPYHVTIHFDKAGIQSCECDCPYEDDYCKHVIAVLLTCICKPTMVTQREGLSNKLAKLNKMQLQVLIEQLAEQGSAWRRQIHLYLDQHASQETTQNSQKSKRKTLINPKPYAQEAKSILHSLDRMRPSEAYWYVDKITQELSSIIGKAKAFIEKNDGNNAIVILNALTSVYIDNWYALDDSNGELGDFFYELDDAWTEAILSADLSQLERKQHAQEMQGWQKEAEDYGIDQAFKKAMVALEQGWDYPPLLQVLNGESVDVDAWDDDQEEGFDCRSSMTSIRIKILERQQRFDECLCLAKAKKMVKEAASLMIQQGQLQEAIDYAKINLKRSHDALLIAQLLRYENTIDQAMTIASLGLELEGSKAELGDWLSDLAENRKQISLALQAITAAFQDKPTLKRYEQALRLVPKNKLKTIKSNLLSLLRQSSSYDCKVAKIDIFLKENLLDDAIQVVDQVSYFHESSVKRVMDAVMHYKPDWVIQQGIKRALEIINPGKARYYEDAVSWLKKVKQAYEAAGKREQWNRSLNALRQQYKSKYKLMGLFDQAFGKSL